MRSANSTRLIRLPVRDLTTPPVACDLLDRQLALTHISGIKFFSLRDIMFLEGSGSYSIITLNTGEKVTSSKPLSQFEARLACDWFFRVHKSYILNIFHLKEYSSRNGDTAIMKNGEEVSISRHRLSAFLSAVENVTGCVRI